MRLPPRGRSISPFGWQEGGDDGLLPKTWVILLAVLVEALPGGLVSERNEERFGVGSLEGHRRLGPPLGEQACHCPLASALEEWVALGDLLRKPPPLLERLRPPTTVSFGEQS